MNSIKLDTIIYLIEAIKEHKHTDPLYSDFLLVAIEGIESGSFDNPELVILWSDLAPMIEHHFLVCASGGRQYASVTNTLPFHSLTKWITESGAQHMNAVETIDWADSIMACSIHY